jgi:transcriptional regulator with XRE-family HTH domain
MQVEGARLRAIRIKKGFSQEQLATKSGYGVRTIRRIELGRHQPQPRTLKDLADALGVDSEELCNSSERPESIRPSASEARMREPILREVMSARLLSGNPRAPSTSFVGRRAELAHLEGLLTDVRAVSIQASVEGLAGVGKTELALQLAYKFAAERTFPAGIFWLEAEDPDLRRTWGGTIAEQCRVAGSSLDERCREVLRQIEEAKAPALVILDNVTSWSSNERPGPLPVGPHIRLLVTTRIRNLGGAQFMHLDISRHVRWGVRAVLSRCPAGEGGDDRGRGAASRRLRRHGGGELSHHLEAHRSVATRGVAARRMLRSRASEP